MYQEYTQEATILLKNIIAIPSFSKEERKVADLLERYIELQGYAVSRKDNNIWLMSPGFDPARPTLLLCSHIDTVKPVAGWTHDPFLPVVENGKLFGLGSNDAGASVVTLLQVFFILSQKKQNYNLIYAAVAEEEISGEKGVSSLLQELPHIDFAVVGEPTGMHLAVAEKGLMVLDCVAYGKSGHAARNEGDNAIYKALEDIIWFKEFIFPEQTAFLGPVKMTVTQINAGTQHNVVPDLCSFVVDVRSNEMYNNQELLEIIMQKVNCTVTARSTRLSSTATPLDHPIVGQGKVLGRKLFGSPTLSDQALLPFPSVKIGPGDSSRSHTANEYVLLKEIEEAIEVYVEILDGVQM
ncbi:putative succinyl-diaminopimelate desuccinylase DapE [bioreactor metagenome]|jgi:acetylornithine deacetylase|uniref:Putative succinyl-diaminopimelate desuccinylase DapE n=1 Tax=bioreactor metagenome TaxID=1076179 RepID=A0A644W5U5_9ZZZZ|nr:M20 family metallo-hydrolase [Paludibacter sp.]